MDVAQQAGAAEGAGAGPASDRRVFVHVMILLVAAMFVAMVSLLYVYWLKTPVPTALLVLKADESLDGVRAVVQGQDVPPVGKTFGKANDYTVRFALPPGQYMLQLVTGNQLVSDHALPALRQYDSVQLRVSRQAATAPAGGSAGARRP